MSKYSNIRVLAARSTKAIDDRQCDVDRNCDTLKEAKAFAHHCLTAEYQLAGEMSEPLNVARVLADEQGREVCLGDFTRPNYYDPYTLGSAVRAKFRRLAELRGFIEIRPSEVSALIIDLGYRQHLWSYGDGLHWLAANLAAVGEHRSHADYRYRNGFPCPCEVAEEYLATTLNRLLPKPAHVP